MNVSYIDSTIFYSYYVEYSYGININLLHLQLSINIIFNLNKFLKYWHNFKILVTSL